MNILKNVFGWFSGFLQSRMLSVVLIAGLGFAGWGWYNSIKSIGTLEQQLKTSEAVSKEWKAEAERRYQDSIRLSNVLADREKRIKNYQQKKEELENSLEELKKNDKEAEKWLESDIPPSIVGGVLKPEDGGATKKQ